MLKLDLSQLAGFLPQGYAVSRQTGLKKAADMLAAGNGPGGNFTGWVALVSKSVAVRSVSMMLNCRPRCLRYWDSHRKRLKNNSVS